MRRLAVLVAVPLASVVALATLSSLSSQAHAAPPERVTYRPPVDAEVVDPFRPPPERWNAGNRGVEYDTTSGEPVAAAADGVVTFAGQVGGQLHVVILHADGVRTTYAFLRATEVRRGDTVHQGQRVGTAADSFHFGARIGQVYVDPLLLFGDGLPEVHLVPEDDLGMATEQEEKRGLLDHLFHFGGQATSALISWAGGRIENRFGEFWGAFHYFQELSPVPHLVRIGQAGLDWARNRDTCTPGDQAQPRLQERRQAVLVGGLGSTSENAAIYELDTAALGYADDDVTRFSYRGGSTKTNDYGPADTTVDIRRSARLLREYLEQIERERPGVPIDVIAHSQGGLVAREALTNEFDGLDPILPPVSSLVTIGTPHQGTDLATAAKMLGFTPIGKRLGQISGLITPWDVRSTSVGQLSETSKFIRDLNRRPLPEGLYATSIGARGDFIVPASRTPYDGAHSVIVSVPGIFDHDQLPSSDQAEREVALAVNHLAPTCQSLVDTMLDAIVSDRLSAVEDLMGSVGWYQGHKVSG